MQTISSQYKYGYRDSDSSPHHAYLISPLLEMLSERRLSSQQKLRVLDLGCGNGSLSHLIAQQGYEVVGVEDCEQGVAIARQSFPDCHFIQGSIYELPYSELANSFDIVISAEVIEHLLYPRELLKAAKKCLKPNGRLILTTPYHGYLKNLAIGLSGKMDQHFNPLWDGGHIKFFSVATLRKLLETENYTDIRFNYSGRLPFLWKSMLCSSSPRSN
ncbi:MAG TPA: class I SAM-dependent methyltransferase [Coleofasciculaceae cyanobacterium]|jgi:2-polyprenyl-3-methyl-5-hydroxy-6-metoxy-1,4-benzoquinol methylase